MLSNLTLGRHVDLCEFEIRFIYLVTQDSQSYIVKPCLEKKRIETKGKEKEINQVAINVNTITQSPSNRKL